MRLNLVLKKLREENRLKQNEVCDKLSINQRTLSNYEVGRTEPDAYTLKQLAKVYNVSVDYLLCISEEEHKQEEIKIMLYTKFKGLSQQQRDKVLNYLDIVRAGKENEIMLEPELLPFVSLIRKLDKNDVSMLKMLAENMADKSIVTHDKINKRA